MNTRSFLLTISFFLCVGQSARAQSPEKPLLLTAVGDINMGTAFPSEKYLPADGGKSLLAPVAHWLKGDVVFGNLEGPLADAGETKKCGKSGNCYAFRTPTSYVSHLKDAGFHVLSLANNHALDFGDAGRKSTVDALDKVGIAHSGAVGDVASLTVRGKKVGLLAFTTAGHSYNLLDIPAAVEAVKKLDADHDLVIVSFHGGDEGSRAVRVPDKMEYLGREPRGHLIQFTHSVVDAGADLVLGHGPHVLRGMEVYRGRLIAYSLGNFCTYGRFTLRGALGRSVVLQVRLDPLTGALVDGQLHATWQTKRGGAKPDPKAGGIADMRRLSKLDFPYTMPAIAKDGSFTPGAGQGAGLFTLATAKERAALWALLGKLRAKKVGMDLLRTAFGDPRAAINKTVLEKFARPAEKVMTYERYRGIFLKPKVLAGGKKFLEEKKEILALVEKKYRVDRQVLTGIIATETRFGVHTGDFFVLNALATQALRMKRRARWATEELRALLKVFKDDPMSVKGSYAGAVGLVQFMPSSILRYGRDWDGDGRINLDQWPDALASAANYLKGKGWKMGAAIKRGQANYKAIWRYNPAHHYVKVVRELTHEFGYKPTGAKKATKKATKKDPKKVSK